MRKICFTISFLFHASTSFEHMCSSSGGQNCICWLEGVGSKEINNAVYLSQYLTNLMHKICFTSIGVMITRGCVIQFWRPDDKHMCSKHVEAWNKKLIAKQILRIKLVKYWDAGSAKRQNFLTFSLDSATVLFRQSPQLTTRCINGIGSLSRLRFLSIG